MRLRGACRAWQGAGWEGGLALTTTAAAGRSFGSFFFGSVDAAAADAAVSVFRVETTTSNPPAVARGTDDVQATPGWTFSESLSSRLKTRRLARERGGRLTQSKVEAGVGGRRTPASASSGSPRARRLGRAPRSSRGRREATLRTRRGIEWSRGPTL